MPLDPEAKMLLEQLTTVVRPFDELSVVEARAAIVTLSAAAGEGEAVARVENRTVPGPRGEIPVRVYTPAGRAPFPVLVYFHGGGWVIGSLETHDGLCRHLANAAGTVVVSVDYRLAPEHPFPASGEDAYAATRWAAADAAVIGGDAKRIAVGGDSAGGNLAAVVSLMARDRGGPPPHKGPRGDERRRERPPRRVRTALSRARPRPCGGTPRLPPARVAEDAGVEAAPRRPARRNRPPQRGADAAAARRPISSAVK